MIATCLVADICFHRRTRAELHYDAHRCGYDGIQGICRLKLTNELVMSTCGTGKGLIVTVATLVRSLVCETCGRAGFFSPQSRPSCGSRKGPTHTLRSRGSCRDQRCFEAYKHRLVVSRRRCRFIPDALLGRYWCGGGGPQGVPGSEPWRSRLWRVSGNGKMSGPEDLEYYENQSHES
jgi:hypothetical protein